MGSKSHLKLASLLKSIKISSKRVPRGLRSKKKVVSLILEAVLAPEKRGGGKKPVKG